MGRSTEVEFVSQHVLPEAAARYGIKPADLRLHGDYMGCQNIIYDYSRGDQEMVLRISFRIDRNFDLIKAEVDFINYLYDHGARVSRAVPSRDGNLVEQVEMEGKSSSVVSFIKGKGMRVPDNQYRYRPGVSIDEYCQNWGQTLGMMHRLTRSYRPNNRVAKRPTWLDWHGTARVDRYIPESLPVVRHKCHDLLDMVQSLPKSPEAYGLIHSDFNDGNFTVDYSNGDITVFDFDDCSYGWFVYELACAWDGGVGRTMFEPDAGKRRAYMDHYFDQVLTGYRREHLLTAEWMERLPIFIKIVEMETLVETLAYFADNDLPIPADQQGRLAYLVRCIEEDLPDLGFYEPIFSHQRPFELEGGGV